MAQAIEKLRAACPLCGESLDLDIADWKVAAKWRDVLSHRDCWSDVSNEFRDCQSIAGAAGRLSISPEVAARILEFLCTDVCGCRTVTCVSCLDDYRSEL
jgi:hypothetical protein